MKVQAGLDSGSDIVLVESNVDDVPYFRFESPTRFPGVVFTFKDVSISLNDDEDVVLSFDYYVVQDPNSVLESDDFDAEDLRQAVGSFIEKAVMRAIELSDGTENQEESEQCQ